MMLDKRTYDAVHKWAATYIQTDKCLHCGVANVRLERANISGDYIRNINDWIILCVPCHRKYDDVNKKMSISISLNRTACIKGHAYSSYGYKIYNNKNGKVRRCIECDRLCRIRYRNKKAGRYL